MKIRRISRRPLAPGSDSDRSPRKRVEIVRTVVALTLAVALIGTGAVALPSLAPVEASMDFPPAKGPQLEPEELASIESIHESAGMLAGSLKETVSDVTKALPATAANVARATTAVTKPIADGVNVIPTSVRMMRATAHEAIKMKKGILPLIPAKFARAEDGVIIPVSLTQYCVQGETRRGRQTRYGIVAADPRIFPLSRYVELYAGSKYLGRFLVDDTGSNIQRARIDIWMATCREAIIFGRVKGTAVLVPRQELQVVQAGAPK